MEETIRQIKQDAHKTISKLKKAFLIEPFFEDSFKIDIKKFNKKLRSGVDHL